MSGSVTSNLFFFKKSIIYYTGHRGKLWQVHSIYLDKEKVKRKKKKREKKNLESNKETNKKRGDKGYTSTLWSHTIMGPYLLLKLKVPGLFTRK